MFSWVERCCALARTLGADVGGRQADFGGHDPHRLRGRNGLRLLAAPTSLTIIPGALVIWFVRNYIARGFALGRV